MRTSVQRVWMHHVALFAVLGVVACGARSDGAPRPTAEHVSSASQPLVSVTTMSSFGGMSGVGQPRGEPLLSGSALYGVSFAGGAFGLGTVYKVNTDGNDYVVLHSFAGGATGGRNPAHGLVQSGSTLYGTTSGDSNTDKGTIFKIDTDGTGFAVLHSFAGAPSSGDPSGRLVLVGSTLYGVTSRGGAANWGSIFKFDLGGGGLSVLKSFVGGVADGAEARGLALAGSTLYGTTRLGGAFREGTVYKMDVDGTGFVLVHSFTSDAGGVSAPEEGVVVVGSTLYGAAFYGGPNNRGGGIYSVNADGTAYAVLHSFDGPPLDASYMGSSGSSSFVVSGSTLYGTSAWGGPSDLGTVLKINTDGTGYALVASFGGANGSHPYGAPLLSGSTLYGATLSGGTYNRGTFYKITNLFACKADEHVAGNACVACAPGSTQPAGDDPTGAATTCTATPCVSDHYVAAHACVLCAAGSTRPAGDLATGADTACSPETCVVDQHVVGHACVACAPGGRRPGGDLATWADTSCTAIVCGANQYVSSNGCLPCAPGGTRPAGDLATGANTACANTVCAANEYVLDHACAPCAAGTTRTAGDLATAADTSCASTTCTVNQYVSNHACVACASGGTRPAGDLATGTDTTCTPSSPADGGPPSPDSGVGTASDAGTSTDDGGCSIAISSSRRGSFGFAGALTILALLGLSRRRDVPRATAEMREKFLVTSMVITHDMATAFEIADRVMLVDKGCFVDEGTPERFFESSNPAVRTFADSSAVDPQKLRARRASRRGAAEIRAAWLEQHRGAGPSR